MIIPDVAQPLIPLAALLIGLLLGGLLTATHNRRSARRRRSAGRADANGDSPAEDRVDVIHAAEAEMAQLDARLAYLNKAIANARQQLQDSSQEHARLLLALDERQASTGETQHALQELRQTLQIRHQESDRLLTDIDRCIEEVDMLDRMKESYLVKVNRLTQQVQWQDSELRMLRQTVKTRTTEIEQEQALIEQRDAELRRLIRQRQQREIDIAHAGKAVSRRDEELRRIVSQGADRPVGRFDLPQGGLPQGDLPVRRVDVTPAERHALPAPETPGTSGTPLSAVPRLSAQVIRRLEAGGIHSADQLAALSLGEVLRLLDLTERQAPQIESWLRAARRLTRRKATAGEG